jgi:hypothetical protein
MDTQIPPAVYSTMPASAFIYLIEEVCSFTDDELVIAAQNGTSAAAGELLSRHRPFLYKKIRRLTASTEEAEDAVQEALLRAYVNIGRFRRESKFSSWLIAIGINSVFFRQEKV